MSETNLQIINLLRTFLLRALEAEGRPLYCQGASDFTRNRILSFQEVALYILSLPKGSLSLEIGRFFKGLGLDKQVWPSSLSRARYKLRAYFFKSWNHYLGQLLQERACLPKRWEGYQLIGIDGTTLHLPDKAAIREHFGLARNQNKGYPMAQVVCAYDVLNHHGLASRIGPIGQGEVSQVCDILPELPSGSLCILDRGLAHFKMMYLAGQPGKDFVMRCKLGLNKELKAFVKSGASSQVVSLSPSSQALAQLRALGHELDPTYTMPVRLVRVALPGGGIEVLATSLLDRSNCKNLELSGARRGSFCCRNLHARILGKNLGKSGLDRHCQDQK